MREKRFHSKCGRVTERYEWDGECRPCSIERKAARRYNKVVGTRVIRTGEVDITITVRRRV